MWNNPILNQLLCYYSGRKVVLILVYLHIIWVVFIKQKNSYGDLILTCFMNTRSDECGEDENKSLLFILSNLFYATEIRLFVDYLIVWSHGDIIKKMGKLSQPCSLTFQVH